MLKEASEKAKHELSTAMETDVNLPFITADGSGPKHLNVKVSRAKFEALCESLLERLTDPCEMAIKDAGVQASDIEDVLHLVSIELKNPAQNVLEQIGAQVANMCVVIHRGATGVHANGVRVQRLKFPHLTSVSIKQF